MTFLCESAERVDLAGVTVLYLFHPFGRGTMEAVISALDRSLKTAPRRFRMAYENPVHAAVVDAASELRRTDAWDETRRGGSRYPVTFRAAGA